MRKRAVHEKRMGRPGLLLAAALVSGCLLCTPAAAQEAAEAVTEAVTEDAGDPSVEAPHGLTMAKDYEQVYEAVKDVHYYWEYNDIYLVEESVEDGAASGSPVVDYAAPAASSEAKTFGTGADYSGTNLRDAAVDEGDIVKTDGRRIFVLHGGTLSIIRADGADLRKEASLEVSALEGGSGAEARAFFVTGDKLILITTENAGPERSRWNWYECLVGERRTVVWTYRLPEEGEPELLGAAWQEGEYCECRRVEGMVYVYSRANPVVEHTFEESTMAASANGEEIPAEQMVLPDRMESETYLIAGAVNTDAPDQLSDVKVVVGGSDFFYATQDSLYVLCMDFSGYSKRTQIIRLACTGGTYEGIAACTIPGEVKDSFCIDEYQGNLRVLTTYTGYTIDAMYIIDELLGRSTDRWTTKNALYILDDRLYVKGRISGIAPGETIRSARYFGDTAWFVTYENTDPLFGADLSDPAKPKLTGKLKVTGYSDYLHPYGEDSLLGIGFETDPETGYIEGLKLSLFDRSDPSEIREITRKVIPGITWLHGLSDYKALLVSPEKNLIGFCYDDRYFVYRLEGDQFERVLLYDFFSDDQYGVNAVQNVRGLFIKDTLYVAGEHTITAFDMTDDFSKETVYEFD